MNHPADWLPFAYAGLVAASLLAYVLMDGWDLGVGIIYSLIARAGDRDRALRSIEPFWDANETWLVLGGMTLLLGFPTAYAELLTLMYVPASGMLLALVLRGVSYEFRYQGGALRDFWGRIFAIGSILAAFCQGCMLGLVVEGVPEQGSMSPGITALRAVFPLICGIGTVGGYVLLGASWLILKTQEALQNTAREVALPALLATTGLLVIVSLCTPLLSAHVAERWFTHEAWPYAGALVAAIAIVVFKLFRSLWRSDDRRPLQWTTALVVLSYIFIVASLFPYIVPYRHTLQSIANDHTTLVFAGIGICVVLPVVFLYLILGYRVFRGKIQGDPMPSTAGPSVASRKTSGHQVDLHMS